MIYDCIFSVLAAGRVDASGAVARIAIGDRAAVVRRAKFAADRAEAGILYEGLFFGFYIVLG